jgi:zinc protease
MPWNPRVIQFKKIVLVALVSSALSSWATTPAPAPAKAPSAKTAGARGTPATQAPLFVRKLGGIEEYRLPNGLQILLFPDEGQSTTTVNITYRVGSRHEGQGEYGMAHLLEHLQFKGTPAHRDIPEEFARRGVRYNGNTDADRTSYFASFNANADTLAWTLGLEADRMRNSFIARADLDKEMTVVRNEFERGENEPMAVLAQRVQAAAYAWHPYGHATIGPKSDIENVPIENLQAFYHRYYRPDNATLFVAGKFDRDAVLSLVAREFGAVARPAGIVPQPYTVEPAQDGERSVTVRRVGGQPALMAYYHLPAFAHPDSPAILVYEQLLSMQPSGSLYKTLVETKAAVGAGVSGLGGHDAWGATAVAVLPPDGDVDKVQQQLLDLVEGRAEAHFDEADLQRVREMALMSYRQQMKDPEALIQQLSNVEATGDWRLQFQVMQELPKVTLADVERVRAAYFRPANRTLGRYLPASEVERVAIPAAPALEERLASLQEPPKVEDGERFVPTPQAIAARTKVETLPSGIVVHTLAKQTRGNTVVATVNLRWSSARETTPLRGTTMVSALMSEGSTTMSRQALQDALVRLKANMQLSSGNQEATLVVTAEKDTLLEALKLAADVMRHPAFPAQPFERMRVAQLAAIEAGRKELGTLMNEATRGPTNAARGAKRWDPDYQASVDEMLDEYRTTTLEDVKRFHAGFWSANDARVAVVGAVPEGFAPAIEQLFGTWKNPAAPAFEQYLPRHIEVAPARYDVQADDKTSAALHLWKGLALNHEDADFQPLRLAAYILGGGSLENRLNTRIRRELGLTYGASADLNCGYWGDDGAFTVDATFAPQNRDKVVAAIEAELAAFTRDGPTEAELARAKHDLLEGLQQGRTDDGGVAGTTIFLDTVHRDWTYVGNRDAQLERVTLAQVNEAWRRHFGDHRFGVVTAGDFKAGAAAAAPTAVGQVEATPKR